MTHLRADEARGGSCRKGLTIHAKRTRPFQRVRFSMPVPRIWWQPGPPRCPKDRGRSPVPEPPAPPLLWPSAPGHSPEAYPWALRPGFSPKPQAGPRFLPGPWWVRIRVGLVSSFRAYRSPLGQVFAGDGPDFSPLHLGRQFTAQGTANAGSVSAPCQISSSSTRRHSTLVQSGMVFPGSFMVSISPGAKARRFFAVNPVLPCPDAEPLVLVHSVHPQPAGLHPHPGSPGEFSAAPCSGCQNRSAPGFPRFSSAQPGPGKLPRSVRRFLPPGDT